MQISRSLLVSDTKFRERIVEILEDELDQKDIRDALKRVQNEFKQEISGKLLKQLSSPLLIKLELKRLLANYLRGHPDKNLLDLLGKAQDSSLKRFLEGTLKDNASLKALIGRGAWLSLQELKSILQDNNEKKINREYYETLRVAARKPNPKDIPDLAVAISLNWEVVLWREGENSFQQTVIQKMEAGEIEVNLARELLKQSVRQERATQQWVLKAEIALDRLDLDEEY